MNYLVMEVFQQDLWLEKMIQDGSKAAGSMFKSIRKGAIQPP